MKRSDWILISTVVMFAIIFWIVNTKIIQKEGDFVTVSVGGEVIHEFSLEEEVDIVIEGANNGTNHLVIQNGEANIIDATCPDKLCIHQKKISKDKETLVCLPHKVVIEVHAKEEQEYDAIVN